MIKVWTALPEMMVARSNHSLTVLPGGEGGGWGAGGYCWRKAWADITTPSGGEGEAQLGEEKQ